MKYIIDIDGTICITPVNDVGVHQYTDAVPLHERIKLINNLYDSGHEIHYWTARGSASGTDRYQITLDQLTKWGVKFHSFNVGKPVYDIWVDDKAIEAGVFFNEEHTRQRNI